MKYTCPKCGKTLEFSVEELTETQYKVTCTQCGSSLEIVGDYAYVPLEDGTLNLADDEPEVEEVFPNRDPLYQAAVDYIVTCNAITPTMLSQYFDIPMERAHELMSQLEAGGIVGPAMGGAPRTILIPHDTNLPGGFRRRYDPNAPQLPPEFRGKIKTYNISCSGCLIFILLITLILMMLK